MEISLQMTLLVDWSPSQKMCQLPIFGYDERGNRYPEAIRCVQDDNKKISFTEGTYTDKRDGKKYKTITVGGKTWFAQNLDFNGNGKIDAKELAFFNENADAIDGAQDGVIKNAGESGMFGAVTGSNASNPEFNRVVNKYLQGETLTAEEQQILQQCQATIRKNMGKAAGINIEG